MILAQIQVSGVEITAKTVSPIPRGIAGATIEIAYTDPVWDGLNKTVVFRGSSVRAVLDAGNVVEVPHETVDAIGCMLQVGVCGMDADSCIVIPTIWTDLGVVTDAAYPDADVSADPTLPVWAQIQQKIEDFETYIRNTAVILPDETGTFVDKSNILFRDGTVPMNGNLSMGLNRITDLNAPVMAGDAVSLGYASANFAPNGFGLGHEGGELVDVTDFNQLNGIIRNGCYFVRFPAYFAIDGQYAQYMALEVASETGVHVHQTFHIIGTNYKLQRNSDNGVWSVLEWVNPPMQFGVEYRTTRRHNGKPVYMKLLSYEPSGFAAQIVSFPHNIANMDMGLSLNVSWSMNGMQRRHFPSVYFGDSSGWNGQVYWDGTVNICFELGGSLASQMAVSPENILVTAEYTKTA